MALEYVLKHGKNRLHVPEGKSKRLTFFKSLYIIAFVHRSTGCTDAMINRLGVSLCGAEMKEPSLLEPVHTGVRKQDL